MLGLVKEAGKIKTSINTQTSFAEDLLRAIETGEQKHRWAKDNIQGDAMIKQVLEQLRGQLTPWHKEFMLCKNFTEFKKKFSGEQVIIELQSFTALADKVKDLETTCDKIIRASNIMS